MFCCICAAEHTSLRRFTAGGDERPCLLFLRFVGMVSSLQNTVFSFSFFYSLQIIETYSDFRDAVGRLLFDVVHGQLKRVSNACQTTSSPPSTSSRLFFFLNGETKGLEIELNY